MWATIALIAFELFSIILYSSLWTHHRYSSLLVCIQIQVLDSFCTLFKIPKSHSVVRPTLTEGDSELDKRLN